MSCLFLRNEKITIPFKFKEAHDKNSLHIKSSENDFELQNVASIISKRILEGSFTSSCFRSFCFIANVSAYILSRVLRFSSC